VNLVSKHEEVVHVWKKVQAALTGGIRQLRFDYERWERNAPWYRVKAQGLDPKRLP
jgi:hypothetical protein